MYSALPNIEPKAMACGFEKLKPEPGAKQSQALGLALAWPGPWLSGQASTSRIGVMMVVMIGDGNQVDMVTEM